VYESCGVSFTPDDLEWGTLGVLVDRYGDPTEVAPEMLAAARTAEWRAALIALKRWSTLLDAPRLCRCLSVSGVVRRSALFDADGAGA
jgi:hypothetical protein